MSSERIDAVTGRSEVTPAKPRSSEIHPGLGFRIRRNIARPAADLVARYRRFETPDVSDLMNRLYTMSPDIKNLVNDEKIVGPACTVKVFPGDNLMVHKALDIAASGDIIVVDAGGSTLGSTEVATYRQFFITKETRLDDSVVPVGYAIEDKEIVLLECDEAGVREIAVKSAYLSPGYWRRPDLTASSFMPDPDGGGKRIFCTGDLGRMEPDGCLQHLGRRDHQVKIRGYRVETGDIEAALLKHPAIKQAGVIVGDDRHGEKKLIAYFASPDREMSAATLRSFVADLLPDCMIPSTFVRLDGLPVTPSGKVDRKALPALEYRSEESFVAPRTPNERTLADIFAAVLMLDQAFTTTSSIWGSLAACDSSDFAREKYLRGRHSVAHLIRVAHRGRFVGVDRAETG